MRENAVKRVWAAGGKVVNGWLAIPAGYSAEVMAHQAFDSITVDLQHGLVDYGAAVHMLQAISTRAATPLVRVPWNEPGLIMKMLDAGAYGVICPMVNDRAACEAFVGACRYAPVGYRSYGPLRGLLYGGADYYAHANDTILTLAMIETAEALDNLADILSVPGLDAIYVGLGDLSVSLGCPPTLDPTEPVVVDAIAAVLAAAHDHGLKAGIHCSGGAGAAGRFAQGFDFCSLANDARLLAAAAKAEIAAARVDC